MPISMANVLELVVLPDHDCYTLTFRLVPFDVGVVDEIDSI